MGATIDPKDFDVFYPMYTHARDLEKAGDYDQAIDIYLRILDRYAPPGTVYYERPAILLERLGRFADAAGICERLLHRHAEHREFHEDTAEEFRHRLERLRHKMDPSPAKKPAAQPSRTPAARLAGSREPTDVAKPTLPAVTAPEIAFPAWYVSLSFGESRAASYPQAIALAKRAPQYREEAVGRQIMHQAVYSNAPKEYLAFIKLYELVKDWKGVFVVINGEVVDRKIVGGLNYCYGDHCRSANPSFCFGASIFTENPFGCHRLQVSAYNNPWWSFGRFDGRRVWHVDKAAILARITEHSEGYRLCPNFSWEAALKALDALPDTVDPAAEQGWLDTGSRLERPIALR